MKITCEVSFFVAHSGVSAFPPVLRMHRKTVEQSASNVSNGSSVDLKSCFCLSVKSHRALFIKNVLLIKICRVCVQTMSDLFLHYFAKI